MAQSRRFQVQFEVSGDGKVKAEFLGVADGAEKAAKAVDKAGKAADDSAKKYAKLQKEAKLAGAVLGTAVVAGLTLFIRNTIQAENEQAQLAAVLKSTGEAAGFSQQKLNDMADAMSKMSTLSSGEITEAQTRLLSYSSIVGENFPRALQLAIDQSTRLGESVTQAAETVGKALEYPAEGVAALTKQGFHFGEEQKKVLKALEKTGRTAEAQAIVMGVMEESYYGAARAARDTLGGALKALTMSFNDLLTGKSGDQGIKGATAAVNDLAATLADPAIRDGFQTMFTGALQAAGAMARFATTTASVTKFLAESAAAAINGPAADDLVRTEARIRRIQKTISDLKTGKSNAFDTTGDLTAIGLPSDRGLELNADYLLGRTGTVIRKLNEELNKEQNKLRVGVTLAEDQAAQAAKIAAEAGAGIKPPNAPVHIPNAEAEKEAAAAAKRLKAAYDSLSASQREQIALFGDTTNAAKVRYALEHGALSGIAPLQKAALIADAERLDAMEDLAAIEATWADAAEDAARRERDRQQAIDAGIEQTDRLINDMRFELELIGLTNDQRERAIAQRHLEAAATDEQRATVDQLIVSMQAARLEQEFKSELKGLFVDIGMDLDRASESVDRFFDNLKRRALEALADAAIQAMFGKGAQGTSTGAGFWANFGSNLASSFGGGRATGGPVSRGSFYEVAEQGKPELLHDANGRTFLIPGSSGTVVPAGGLGGPMMGGGGGGPMQVIVNNSTDGRVSARQETQQQPDGTVLRRMIIDVVSESLDGGQLGSVGKARYGWRDQI